MNSRLLLVPALAITLGPTPGQQPAERPNIVLVMADDLGFADLGCYGSEIETPNLDALAANGLRFTQFYNTAKCHSSRVSLLTGLYCDQAGGASLKRGATIAEVLSGSGYSTAMSGKWHLSKQPTDFGFQRYWGHLSGATNFFTGADPTVAIVEDSFALAVTPRLGESAEVLAGDGLLVARELCEVVGEALVVTGIPVGPESFQEDEGESFGAGIGGHRGSSIPFLTGVGPIRHLFEKGGERRSGPITSGALTLGR